MPTAQADAVDVLREAIAAALPPLQLADEDPEDRHAVLSAFARAVSPVLDDLAVLAAAEPDGPVATALHHLRRAYNHRGTGSVSPGARWQLRRAGLALDRH